MKDRDHHIRATITISATYDGEELMGAYRLKLNRAVNAAILRGLLRGQDGANEAIQGRLLDSTIQVDVERESTFQLNPSDLARSRAWLEAHGTDKPSDHDVFSLAAEFARLRGTSTRLIRDAVAAFFDEVAPGDGGGDVAAAHARILRDSLIARLDRTRELNEDTAAMLADRAGEKPAIDQGTQVVPGRATSSQVTIGRGGKAGR